jgi:hypothetical protein
MPSNGLQSIFKKWAIDIETFNQKNIVWGTVYSRIQDGRRSMPASFQLSLPIFIIDSTHVPVNYHNPAGVFGIEGDSPYSFKLNKMAVNLQVVINGNTQCIWTDNGQPGGVHDIRSVWRSDLEIRIDK